MGYRGIEGGDAATKPVFNVRKLKKKNDINGGSLKWTTMVVVQEPNERLFFMALIPCEKPKSNRNNNGEKYFERYRRDSAG